MSAFILLETDVILAIHEEQIAVHGGGIGLRDSGLLASALARAENKIAYEQESDCSSIAATYAFGIARNHPFVDGNKRTALVAAELFLSVNGFELTATDTEAVVVMLSLAAGDISETEFADWIRSKINPRSAR